MNIADLSNQIEAYKQVRALTISICKPLLVEDHVPQPAAFVSPPKWHLAHTTWFFETIILEPHFSGYKIFHEDFNFLFNSYYNFVGKRVFRADRGNMTRPSLDEVHAYRAYVDEHMMQLLESELSSTVRSLLAIGLNHEQQHQELLITDLKFILGNNPLFPIYKMDGDLVSTQNLESGWIAIKADLHEVGAQGSGFAYDNEFGRHKVFINDFEINMALVTNGEFIQFIEDGSYQNHDLWLDEGWEWVNSNQVRAPLYWHKIEGKWHHFTLGGLKLIAPDDVLCHVSHFEAAAFAEWKGMRLPTEQEWEVASDRLKWGQRWEHTNSAYLAYPGFKKAEGAVGEYNGKFMMNQMVLRGGSAATSSMHSRSTYRNFFQPNMQWQFSGIRLVKND